MLHYREQGEIHWVADRAHRDASWWLYFDIVGESRYAPPYAANVGFGDELMLNCDGSAPIKVPMHSAPISVDWDGDGKVDMLVGSHYSNTLGMPWDGVFFFRNIGSNHSPFFNLPLRLRARGVESEFRTYSETPVTEESGFISEYYLCFDLFDWFGTGRQDLVTLSLRNESIQVYRHTGVRDHNGLPILELAQKISLPEGINRTGYPGLRVLDWFGDGRPTLIITHTGDVLSVWHCTSPPGEEPRFENPPWALSQENDKPVPGNFSFDLCDFAGDGRRDLVVNELGLPSRVCAFIEMSERRRSPCTAMPGAWKGSAVEDSPSPVGWRMTPFMGCWWEGTMHASATGRWPAGMMMVWLAMWIADT